MTWNCGKISYRHERRSRFVTGLKRDAESYPARNDALAIDINENIMMLRFLAMGRPRIHYVRKRAK